MIYRKCVVLLALQEVSQFLRYVSNSGEAEFQQSGWLGVKILTLSEATI